MKVFGLNYHLRWKWSKLNQHLHVPSFLRKAFTLHEPASGSPKHCGIFLARSSHGPDSRRPRPVPKQGYATYAIAVTGWFLAVCADRLSLLVSARCPRPPPHPLPLPLCLAHFWWQRAEFGPCHHSEPQQDPAGFCSGVPQRQTHCCYKPTEFWVKDCI